MTCTSRVPARFNVPAMIWLPVSLSTATLLPVTDDSFVSLDPLDNHPISRNLGLGWDVDDVPIIEQAGIQALGQRLHLLI